MPASRLVAPVVALALALGLTACGSDSGSGTSSNASAGQRPNGGRGFLADPKVQACLTRQGVTVPSGGRRPNGGTPNGQPPSGGNSQPPAGANGSRGNSAQFEKLRKALQKCGVNFPAGGQNGPPQQPDQTTNSTSAS